MKKYWILALSIFLFLQCKQKNDASFYFWKTTYSISPFEEKYLDSLNVQKLYVRFFDVAAKNGKAVPVGEIIIQEKNTRQQIIPVVFITNETFKTLNKNAIEKMASNVQKEIEFIYPRISDKTLQEIQFDCDWTVSTRNKYFYFLNIMQKNCAGMDLSATIRLHQIKDKEQTGVPPVKKGVLMYYATSNPLDFTTQNSILDNNLAGNYIKELRHYPLSLDIALPIYSWAIVQNQLGEKRLINDIRTSDLSDTSIYKIIKPGFYLVKKDHYLKGNYLYEDFMVKTENTNMKDLSVAHKNYSPKLKNKELNTIFFQLDSSNLTHYSIQDLKTIIK